MLILLGRYWYLVVIAGLLALLGVQKMQVDWLRIDLKQAQLNVTTYRTANAKNIAAISSLKAEVENAIDLGEQRLKRKGRVLSSIKEIDDLPEPQVCKGTSSGHPINQPDEVTHEERDVNSTDDPILRELNRMYDGSGGSPDGVHKTTGPPATGRSGLLPGHLEEKRQ